MNFIDRLRGQHLELTVVKIFLFLAALLGLAIYGAIQLGHYLQSLAQ